MDLKAQPFDGNTFNHSLQDIAHKYSGDHTPEYFVAPLGSGGQQAQAPGSIPEWRMEEINAVIEIVSPFA